MTDVTALREHLRQHLPWHRARLTLAASFVLALIKMRTVTLTSLALVINPFAYPSSSYRRLQRFLADFPMDQHLVARFVLQLLPNADSLVITLDRTHWRFGRKDLNVLMLGVAYRGAAFPLCWRLLGKPGNSNREERRALLGRLLDLVPPERIRAVVADREFIGEGWFADLKSYRLPFYVRIKHNALVGSMGRTRHARSHFQHLDRKTPKVLPKRCWVYGHRLSLAGMRLDDEYLIVATNAKPHHAFAVYAQRWQIETLFGALKSRGFDLEATHLNRDERIEKLLALLAIAFAWAHVVGEWLHHVSPIPMKQHGRPAKSLFRYGLDHLRFALLNLPYTQIEYERCLRCLSRERVLSCT